MMVRVTQAHIDAREDSIVESALGLFARKGIERTTMQEIATDAEVALECHLMADEFDRFVGQGRRSHGKLRTQKGPPPG